MVHILSYNIVHPIPKIYHRIVCIACLYTPFQVTFNRPEKLGSYSCTAANSLGKITRRFNLIEGFKPKMPSGLSVSRVGDNYIELQVLPNDKGDELIGYRVEYVTRVVEPSGNTFESFDMMNFNTTEGTCNLRLSPVPRRNYSLHNSVPHLKKVVV